MRVLLLVALCLAAASATSRQQSNRSQFQRLLRALQRQQQQQDLEQGYGPRYQSNQYDDQDDDDEQDDESCQQGQCGRYQQQCSRNQRYGSLNLDDDESECDEDDYQCQQQQQQQQQDLDEQQGSRRQGQQGQQQRRRQQQQRHQCQPKYQLLQELEQPNAQLASKLYKQAKQENDDKNTVVSPAALQLALAAIQRGARGPTKRQLQRITGAGLNQQQNRQAHTALQQSLQGQDPLQRQTGQPQQAKVKATTTIVINQRNQAQKQFIQAVQACLNAQVKKCNFQRQPQQCRQQINRHVAQKTNQQLRQAVPQDAVTENTKMIVVNTAQVKARWGRQFRQQQQTKQGRFYPLGSQQPKRVQLLQSQGQFNYYEDEQLQVVGVPTQQEEMTLYVIVPKNKDGLNQVEKAQIQDGQQLKQLLEQAEQQQEQVEVQLPKFQIKHKLDAKQTLRKQGVQDIFDADEADLSGISGQQQDEQQQQQQRRRRQQRGQNDDEDQYQQDQQDDEQRQQQLHVNKLIHQATIKVDEQGISAARQQQGQQQRQQRQQYQQQQEQDEDDEEQQGQYDDEDDEQEQQYLQQQELFDDIFGQAQRRQRQRRSRQQQQQQYQDEQGQYGEEKRVKANRAFAFALKHNPSNQIVMVGRVVDAAQKPKQHGQRQQGQQSLNGVDQQ